MAGYDVSKFPEMSTANGFCDLTGQRYGKLLVVAYGGVRGKLAQWICRCDCGTWRAAYRGHLKDGHTVSCGCRRAEKNIELRQTHGMEGTPIYQCWQGMLNRCRNNNDIGYERYGGRGITVCDRWMRFANFYEDMGDRPSPQHTLDRCDNNKGYGPDNCRWSTKREQAQNTRRNLIITFRGESKCLAQWAREFGMHPSVVNGRIKIGWTVEHALTTPLRWRRRKHGNV